jgi:hypothetical protein
VTEQQWRIVRALLELGPLEPRQIVEAVRDQQPQPGRGAGAHGRPGPGDARRLGHDARRLQVALTPKSRALARRLAPRIEAIYADLEAQLGTRFSQDFYRTLDELIGST